MFKKMLVMDEDMLRCDESGKWCALSRWELLGLKNSGPEKARAEARFRTIRKLKFRNFPCQFSRGLTKVNHLMTLSRRQHLRAQHASSEDGLIPGWLPAILARSFVPVVHGKTKTGSGSRCKARRGSEASLCLCI